MLPASSVKHKAVEVNHGKQKEQIVPCLGVGRSGGDRVGCQNCSRRSVRAFFPSSKGRGSYVARGRHEHYVVVAQFNKVGGSQVNDSAWIDGQKYRGPVVMALRRKEGGFRGKNGKV